MQRQLFALAILLLCVLADAQTVPGPPPPSSLESTIADATNVYVGRLVAYDGKSFEGTIAIEQTLLGEQKKELHVFLDRPGLAPGKWKEASSRLFVASGRYSLRIIDLSDEKLGVLTADLELIRDPEKVVDAAKRIIQAAGSKGGRVFARPVPKKLVRGTSLEHSPSALSGANVSGYISLDVPIDERLGKWARAAIRSKNMDERLYAVYALMYFKSDENIKLLKSLLDDRGFIDEGKVRFYPMREQAYLLLKEWGVVVPKPITEVPRPKT